MKKLYKTLTLLFVCAITLTITPVDNIFASTYNNRGSGYALTAYDTHTSTVGTSRYFTYGTTTIYSGNYHRNGVDVAWVSGTNKGSNRATSAYSPLYYSAGSNTSSGYIKKQLKLLGTTNIDIKCLD